MRASRPESTFHAATRQLVPAIRRAFKGTLILNSDYLLDDASRALRLREADAIAFGRPFLANPDLPARFAKRVPLNPAKYNDVLHAGARRVHRLSDVSAGSGSRDDGLLAAAGRMISNTH